MPGSACGSRKKKIRQRQCNGRFNVKSKIRNNGKEQNQEICTQVSDHVNLEVQTARVSLSQAMEQVQLTRNSLEKARKNEHIKK